MYIFGVSMGTLPLSPRCSLENDQIALLFDFVCVYTINLLTGECFPFFSPSPPVSVLYDSKSVLHFVQPVSSPSPSYGSLLSEDFLKLSIPSARTHFTCFPYLDSILLIGGYFFLSLLSHLLSVSRTGHNLFDVWKFLPSKLQWTLLCEDRGETMLPGASYALYGDYIIGFGGALPRISLFFLHRSLWKTISLVSPREPPHRQEGSASLFPQAIAVETLDSHSTLFTLGGSTFPPSVPATAFLRTVSCDTSQLARCQRVPAGLFPRFPFF